MIDWIQNMTVELRGGFALMFMVWMTFVLALGANNVWDFISKLWKNKNKTSKE